MDTNQLNMYVSRRSSRAVCMYVHVDLPPPVPSPLLPGSSAAQQALVGDNEETR